MLGLDGIHRASSSRIGPRASARSSRLTTIGLSRRFLAGSNAAADNHRIGNARSSFHGGLSRTRVRLPPPPPKLFVRKPPCPVHYEEWAATANAFVHGTLIDPQTGSGASGMVQSLAHGEKCLYM